MIAWSWTGNKSLGVPVLKKVPWRDIPPPGLHEWRYWYISLTTKHIRVVLRVSIYKITYKYTRILTSPFMTTHIIMGSHLKLWFIDDCNISKSTLIWNYVNKFVTGVIWVEMVFDQMLTFTHLQLQLEMDTYCGHNKYSVFHRRWTWFFPALLSWCSNWPKFYQLIATEWRIYASVI